MKFVNFTSAFICLTACLYFTTSALAYTPPAGIPNPADHWGGAIDPIEEPVPDSATVCPNWPDQDDNCYYVDNSAARSQSGQGESHTIYTDFQSRYGVPINTGYAGTTRPRDGRWDIGALEYNRQTPIISPPSNLRVRAKINSYF